MKAKMDRRATEAERVMKTEDMCRLLVMKPRITGTRLILEN